MTNVVPFRRSAHPVPTFATAPCGLSAARERVRRADVLLSITDNARHAARGTSLVLRVVDGHDGWHAHLESGGRGFHVAGPLASVDDLARVVRLHVSDWIAVHARRAAMTAVHP